MSASKFLPNPQKSHGNWRLKAWDYINQKSKYLGTFETKEECIVTFNKFLTKQILEGAELPIPKGINISFVNNKPRFLLQVRVDGIKKTIYSSYNLTDTLNERSKIISQLINI